MGSLFRRKKTLPDGRTELADKYTIVYEDSEGRRRHENAYSDKAASKQLLAQREREAARQEVGLTDPYAEHRKRSLTEHVQEYESHLRAKGATAKHIRDVVSRLKRTFEGMGVARFDSLRNEATERFLLALGESEGLSKRTRNQYLTDLRAFVGWGIKTRRWPTNPLASVKPLKGEDDVRRRRRAFSEDELQRLFLATETRPVLDVLKRKKVTDKARRKAELEGRERALCYRLMAYAGLRVNEVRTLTWRALDLDGEPAKVTIEAQHAKSKRRDTIPLHDSVAGLLRPWRKDVVALRGVIPNPQRRVFRVPTHPERAFAKDLEAAEIAAVNDQGEVVDLHSLRHTCSTMLTRANVPPRIVQALMRHADLSTTMRTYTHMELYDLAGAVTALPDVESKHERVRAVANGGTTGDAGCQHICQQFSRAEGQDAATRDKPRHARGKASHGATSSRVSPLGDVRHDESTQVGKGEMVGVTGFEPATSASRTQRSSQAEPHPDGEDKSIIRGVLTDASAEWAGGLDCGTSARACRLRSLKACASAMFGPRLT